MKVSVIAPPHLEDNTNPSLAIRTAVEADNALLGYLTGTDDFNETEKNQLNAMRPASVRENFMLACSEQEGTVRAQDDETDLRFRGFGYISFPLKEDKHTASAMFTFVDDYDEAVFVALLDQMKQMCAERGRTLLSVWMVMAPDGAETDPRADSLRAAGFEQGITEQMSILDVDKVTEAKLPDGLQAVAFEGYVPPEEHLDSFLEIMAIADTDIPSSVKHEAADWSRERLEEVERHHARNGRTCLNMLLVDTDGVAAFSYLIIDPDTPKCAEQELTVVHRRARRKGYGMLVKQALWQELAARFPNVERVSTYNATTNTGMLAINEKLGMKPVSVETSWQLKL